MKRSCLSIGQSSPPPQDRHGATPLYDAACGCDREAMAWLLLDLNADVNSQCEDGQTPLHGTPHA